MPRVPYTGTLEVGLKNIPLPSDAPIAAFGGATAQATQQLGNSLERAGDEIFKQAVAMQQVANQTEASDAAAEYMIQAGKLHADYGALQGREAVDAYPAFAENVRKLQEDMSQKLSNGMAKKMFDSETRGTMARTIYSGAGHSATQLKAWSIGSAQASADLSAKWIEDNPTDDVGHRDRMNDIIAKTDEVSAARGLSESQAELARKTAISKATALRIIGLSRIDITAAGSMLDRDAKLLSEPDRLHVDQVVTTQRRSVESGRIALQVYDPTKPLRDNQDAARAAAKKLAPNDPILEQHAVAAVDGRYNQDKRATAQERYENTEAVNAAISEGVRDVNDLLSRPGMSAIVAALPERDRLALPGRINTFNAARDKVANEDRFKTLLGLAQNDPEAFMDIDPLSEKLNQNQMNVIRSMQAKAREKPGGDPQVTAAMNQIKGARAAELQALRIYKRSDNEELYDQFTGALQSALMAWRQENGKAPSYKDITETIAPMLLRETHQRNWFERTLGINDERRFEQLLGQAVPDAWAAEARRRVLAAGRPEPTDADIKRAYLRETFSKLFAKPKKDTTRVGD